MQSRGGQLAADNGNGQAANAPAGYSYNGGGRMVIEDFQEPNVRLDYFGGTATYAGFDRHGRVKQQAWVDYNGQNPADVEKFAYGYDRNSNRLYRQNLIDPNFSELYQPNDANEFGSNRPYDGLDRLREFRRGILSDDKKSVATASRSQSFLSISSMPPQLMEPSPLTWKLKPSDSSHSLSALTPAMKKPPLIPSAKENLQALPNLPSTSSTVPTGTFFLSLSSFSIALWRMASMSKMTVDPGRLVWGIAAGSTPRHVAMAAARTTRVATRFTLRSLRLMGSWWVVRGQGAAGSPYRRISQTPA